MHTTENVFCFVLIQLQSHVSDVSKNIYQALKTRILSIKNPNLIHLMGYLNNHSFLISGTLDAFEVKPKKSAVILLAKDLLLRLLPCNIDFEIQVEEIFGMKRQLEKAIQSAELKQELNNEDLSIKYVNKEFSVIESTRKCISNLETLFQCLKIIQPTSVESEQVFSACGLFVTNLRSSLNDNTIDTLCFLKSYYKNNKNDEKIETKIGFLI